MKPIYQAHIEPIPIPIKSLNFKPIPIPIIGIGIGYSGIADYRSNPTLRFIVPSNMNSLICLFETILYMWMCSIFSIVIIDYQAVRFLHILSLTKVKCLFYRAFDQISGK